MTGRHELPLGLLILTLAIPISSFTTTRSNFSISTRIMSPYDPFRTIRLHELPKSSEPICCLVPPASDGLAPTAEFLSFEEWKSKQFALQAETDNQTAAETPKPDNGTGSPQASSLTTSGESDPSLPAVVEHPVVSPHFQIPLTDRFNYASLDCSARVHASHREARSPSAILSSKKDRYMLSPCSAQPNFVVVELCDDIRIDTVQLANFEFFSGVFRDFRVSVSQRYTTDGKGWVEMGTYRAKNIRGVQSFHPPAEMRPFYRYIRIDFLSHYGNEFYCPISLLRVYGLTQLEEWKWEMWQTLPEGTVLASPQTVAATMKEEQMASPVVPNSTVDSSLPEASQPFIVPQSSSETPQSSWITTSEKERRPESVSGVYPKMPKSTESPTTTREAVPLTTTSQSSPSVPQPTTTPTNDAHIPNDSSSASRDISTSVSSPPDNGSTISAVTTTVSTSSSSSTVPTVVAIPPQPPVPAGESIYRTIMNRLIMLEANTTLYQKYVQEQTMRIHEGLRKMEEDIGRLDGISKAQQMTFTKAMQELDRRRKLMEEERLELLERVNSLSEEVILEKRLGIAQLCLLLTVLIFMALTRGSRAEAASFFDGTMHRLSGFGRGRRSPWSSVDWSHEYGSPPLTPVPYHRDTEVEQEKRSVTIRSRDDEDDPSLLIPPSTPKLARPSSRRAHSPRSHNNTPRPKSVERPTSRLRRSNSHTASAPVSVTRRLAKTAHLHELQRSVQRPRPRSGHWDGSSEDEKVDGSPKTRKKAGALKAQSVEQQPGQPSPKSEGPDATEGESWVDTEPGSEHSFDASESESLADRLPAGL